ncbi:MAG: TM2 domain-containing protein [Bacteroidota bacterium]|nr:TM2 domain-containing protein [Bacteroidota bacterium]MDP4225920.1 TM2 domain-containing protein [Bacteroidota bacterium]MDP4272888.1 TM2 domain-containing protein [Bacteroidota bacterium]
MKKIIFMLGISFFSVSFLFAGENYKLDDQKVDVMFTNATEISLTQWASPEQGKLAMPALTFARLANDDSKAITSFLLCTFLGGFGIHRMYLRSTNSMWALYTFTVCGIFGIVPTVDWFVLLIDGIINKNISKYENNPKFFMW